MTSFTITRQKYANGYQARGIMRDGTTRYMFGSTFNQLLANVMLRFHPYGTRQ